MRVPAIYFWTWIFIAFIWLYLKPKRILDRLWRNTLSIHSGKRTNYVTWSLFLEINFYSILRFTRTIDLVKGVGWSSTYDVFFFCNENNSFQTKILLYSIREMTVMKSYLASTICFFKGGAKNHFLLEALNSNSSSSFCHTFENLRRQLLSHSPLPMSLSIIEVTN